LPKVLANALTSFLQQLKFASRLVRAQFQRF